MRFTALLNKPKEDIFAQRIRREKRRAKWRKWVFIGEIALLVMLGPPYLVWMIIFMGQQFGLFL